MPNTTYPIVEIFHSIQGEGLMAGTPAFFIRFGGCNLECQFDKTHKCDEPLHTDKDKVVYMDTMQIDAAARGVEGTLNIIITGGEPSMNKDIASLISNLKKLGFYVAVETNGFNIGRLLKADLITYSPKVAFSTKATLIPYDIDKFKDLSIELKLLAGEGHPVDPFWDDYPIKFLQPIGFEKELDMKNVNYCSKFVTNNPDWMLSIQMQKVLKVQ